MPPGVVSGPEYTPPSPQQTMITPGDDGGCEWPAGAFSPRTGFVYYGTRDEPALYQTFPNNTEGKGSTFSEDIPGVDDEGIFGATDTTTGRVVWKIQVDQPAKSGLAVAGDLVFFGESNGRFHAADARTGRVLFTFDGTSVPGGGANANPSVYVVNGREFVVNAFGGNFADRDLEGSPPGDALIAFALPSGQ